MVFDPLLTPLKKTPFRGGPKWGQKGGSPKNRFTRLLASGRGVKKGVKNGHFWTPGSGEKAQYSAKWHFWQNLTENFHWIISVPPLPPIFDFGGFKGGSKWPFLDLFRGGSKMIKKGSKSGIFEMR